MAEINWIWCGPNGPTVSLPILPQKKDPLIKACPDCPMTFVRPSDLIRHRLKHRRRFTCPHCQTRFTFVSNLKRHMRQSCPQQSKLSVVVSDDSELNHESNLSPSDSYESMLDSILGTPLKNFRWTDYSPILLTK